MIIIRARRAARNLRDVLERAPRAPLGVQRVRERGVRETLRDSRRERRSVWGGRVAVEIGLHRRDRSTRRVELHRDLRVSLRVHQRLGQRRVRVVHLGRLGLALFLRGRRFRRLLRGSPGGVFALRALRRRLLAILARGRRRRRGAVLRLRRRRRRQPRARDVDHAPQSQPSADDVREAGDDLGDLSAGRGPGPVGRQRVRARHRRGRGHQTLFARELLHRRLERLLRVAQGFVRLFDRVAGRRRRRRVDGVLRRGDRFFPPRRDVLLRGFDRLPRLVLRRAPERDELRLVRRGVVLRVRVEQRRAQVERHGPLALVWIFRGVVRLLRFGYGDVHDVERRALLRAARRGDELVVGYGSVAARRAVGGGRGEDGGRG
eukprot:30891-Pelagococcus_subviridis.AAC.4